MRAGGAGFPPKHLAIEASRGQARAGAEAHICVMHRDHEEEHRVLDHMKANGICSDWWCCLGHSPPCILYMSV